MIFNFLHSNLKDQKQNDDINNNIKKSTQQHRQQNVKIPEVPQNTINQRNININNKQQQQQKYRNNYNQQKQEITAATN